MKCSKCGNEFNEERFCPVCGYPSDESARISDERRKYASQFSDGFETMDPNEETNKIIDRATQAQRYDSQFSSDYSQLFAEYEKSANKSENNRNVDLNKQENSNDFNEEISSNSDENLSFYEDSFEGEKEEETISKPSKAPVIIFLVIFILSLLIGAAWIILDIMKSVPDDNNSPTENASQSQLPTSSLTQPPTQPSEQELVTEISTEATTQMSTQAVVEVATQPPTEALTEESTQQPTLAPPLPKPTDAQQEETTEGASESAVVFPEDFVDQDNDGYDDNTDIFYGFAD